MPSNDERPIFVIGFPRSGTSLLQALLGAHPRIAAPPEVHFRLRILSLADHWGDLADDTNLRRVVHALLHPPVPLYESTGLTEEAVYERAARGPRTYPAILDAMLTEFACIRGKPRWSEKTPGQRASHAVGLFPDAQLVHIVRDPRDAVASGIAAAWSDSNPWLLARAWRDLELDADRVADRLDHSGYLRVRYEDLAADPEPVMREVCAFLGEEFVPAVLDDIEARRPAVANAVAPWQGRVLGPVTAARRRRDHLRWDRLARVVAVTHEVLAARGYEPPPWWRVAGGRLLNGLLLPQALPRLRWHVRGWRARDRPDRRAALIEAYLEERAQAVRAAGAPFGDARRAADG